jgi:predicted RNA-binding Zn ribbon-like protein
MNLAHYAIEIPYDALAENLINTHDVSLAEPEHLRAPEDLRRFMAHHELDPGEPTARELDAAREVRSAARRVFEARDAAQAIRRINALLQGKPYAARLRLEDGAPAIDWGVDPEHGVIQRLEAAVALNMAVLLQTVGFDRFRICEGSPCRDVFIDLSKKGGRIFCGPRCASRVHVARFRMRQRE